MRWAMCWTGVMIGTLLVGCRSPTSAPVGPLPEVTRAQVMALAEAYRTHRWVPGEVNVKHGKDRRGVRVDTPDVGYRPAEGEPGWWAPGQVAVGVPYQWGGFCSLAEFDVGVERGLAAGDVYTQAKRRQLEGAVSKQAVGIDCSGFVSRCWRLPRAYSTRELPTVCEPIHSWEDLQPGDLLNTYNAHCMLFVRWADPMRSRVVTVEAGSSKAWKVIQREHEVAKLMGFHYRLYRYRGIRD